MKPMALAGVAALAFLTACASAPDSPVAGAPADPLAETNKTFRALYAENRLERLARSGPAIIVQFDDLVLYRDGKEVERATFTPPLYHDLKSIAHIPLSVAVVYANAVEQPGDATWRGELGRLQTHLDALTAEFLAARFPSDLIGEQTAIVTRSKDAVAAMLTADAPKKALLTDYLAAIMPPLMRNIDVAAQVQIDGLHALSSAWASDLGAAAWDDVHVVVLGPKTPRAGNLQYEYFARVMGDAARGDRLVYAEGMFAPEPALSLLGTLIQDRAAAEIFFADRMRLDRDLLADAAQVHLDRVFAGQ